jgi:nucleoside 2-deoxyribosyltransferase
MKIAVIGSSQYRDRFFKHADAMIKAGNDVRMPAFDDHPDFDELAVCAFNRAAIEWADRVDIIWDQRSTGTIFDFGMAFAMRKPVQIIYLETKTFRGVMEKYAADVGQVG